MIPFYDLHTMEILKGFEDELDVAHEYYEYNIAVLYGCPLFARLQKDGILDDEKRQSVLRRMLSSEKSDYDKRRKFLFETRYNDRSIYGAMDAK
jgi:hypothetical protein